MRLATSTTETLTDLTTDLVMANNNDPRTPHDMATHPAPSGWRATHPNPGPTTKYPCPVCAECHKSWGELFMQSVVLDGYIRSVLDSSKRSTVSDELRIGPATPAKTQQSTPITTLNTTTACSICQSQASR